MNPQKSKESAQQVFSDLEKAAMKERAAELKAARKPKSKTYGETDVLAKLAELPEPDRTTGTRLHELIKSNFADLTPRTWYGMPAYARDGKVICFFQSAQKFQSRYCTIGFSDSATLDEGDFWPTSFGLNTLTPAIEQQIIALVRKAVGG